MDKVKKKFMSASHIPSSELYRVELVHRLQTQNRPQLNNAEHYMKLLEADETK